MDEILTSSVFDHYDKTYLLDLYKGNRPRAVVRITETVHKGTRRGKYTLEVDAAVLKRIMDFMEAPIPPPPKSTHVRKPRFFTGEQCDAIKRNYLKGVSSEYLAMQYGCKARDIETALRDEGIVIVDPHDANKRTRKRGDSTQPTSYSKVTVKGAGLASARSRHPNAYDRWTEEEDERLVEMYAKGASIERLMEEFGRQRGAITSRLNKFGH